MLACTPTSRLRKDNENDRLPMCDEAYIDTHLRCQFFVLFFVHSMIRVSTISSQASERDVQKKNNEHFVSMYMYVFVYVCEH